MSRHAAIPIIVAEWEAGERRALLTALLTGRHNMGTELDKLEQKLARLSGARPLLMFNRARFGLQLALQLFSRLRPQRDEVIVPAYICPSVIHAVEQCHLKPVAADVRNDLNIDPAQVKQRLGSRTLAVIAAHMYGLPAEIEDLEALCSANGVFLIDDAAQVAGVTVSGKPLGVFGDCGILSFSQSKTIVAGDRNAGGVLLINKSEFESPLRAAWSALPEPRYGLSDIPWFFLDGALHEQGRSLPYYAQAARRRLTGKDAGHPAEVARKMTNVSAAVALCQLDSLSSRVTRRTQIVAEFQTCLAPSQLFAMPQYRRDTYLTRVLIRPPEALSVSTLRSRLRARGIVTRKAYPRVEAFRNEPLLAQAHSESLVEIPSHSRMTSGTIDDICSELSRALG